MIDATELREWLIDLFPSFQEEWEENENDITLHGVLIVFTQYFGAEKDKFNEKQIKILAEFINKSVVKDDDLENAISTCFLEHLNQINSGKLMKPFLSKLAKDKMHA
jgi:hypothetical protein